MGKVIAVTGKGGTGKTAVTAMLIRHLVKSSGKNYRILAIDADPDANLADALGVPSTALEGVRFSFENFKQLPGELPAAQVRRQALLNLVSNALKFVSKNGHGSVDVHATFVEPDDHAHVMILIKSDSITIAIRDSR